MTLLSDLNEIKNATERANPGQKFDMVLFIDEVQFSTDCFAGLTRIEFHEDNGTPCTARWFALSELDLPGGPALFPAGLKHTLLQAART